MFRRLVLRVRPSTRSVTINRAAPPALPLKEQREFEELLRKANTPLSQDDLGVHPDALPPQKPEFEGDTNPTTGEKGGPKREPVKKYGEDPGGDWSFKGRVTDF